MKIITLIALIGLALAALSTGYWLYVERIGNPRVARELIDHPDGERAGKVMLITLPSGRRLPVNYLRQGDRVYAGADGTWWKELVGSGVPVTILVRGESLRGRARAVTDDPAYTERIFATLRPKAIKGFGTLVEIRLDDAPDAGGASG